MALTGPLTIHIDGAARGNPGPAAYGCVFVHDGQVIHECSGRLGTATNNQAEYSALIHALEKARDFGARQIVVKSDSELLVRQMTGVYRVRNRTLMELYARAQQLVAEFDDVHFEHIRRADNAEADRLCNEALDQETGPRRKRRSPSTPAATGTEPASESAEMVLHRAAVLWSRNGDPDQPPPAEVWQAILSRLKQEGWRPPRRRSRR